MSKQYCVFAIVKKDNKFLACKKTINKANVIKYTLPGVLVGSLEYPALRTYVSNELQKLGIVIGRLLNEYGPYSVAYSNKNYCYIVQVYDLLFLREIGRDKYFYVPLKFLDSRYYISLLEPFIIEYLGLNMQIINEMLTDYYYRFNNDLYEIIKRLVLKTKNMEVPTNISNVNQMINYYFKNNTDQFSKDNKKIIKELIKRIWLCGDIFKEMPAN